MKFVRTLLFALFTLPLLAGPVIDLTNKSGTEIKAEILAVTDTDVTFRRQSDQKVFTLSLSLLSDSSVNLLKNAAETLTPTHPAYLFDVSVSKRRKKKENSTYMVDMEVSAKITARNMSHDLNSPGFKGRLIFVGRNQRYIERYQILDIADFSGSPKSAQTWTFETPAFLTTYDSDKKGDYGNLGGFKYEGYVLIVQDADGTILHTKTLEGNFRKGLEEEPGMIDRLLKITKLSYVTERLTHLDPSQNSGIRN